jgi:hypothetical protein
MAEQIVLTPGGYRPKSLVHEVGPRGVRVDKGLLRRFDTSRNKWSQPLEFPVSPLDLPPLGSGWIAFASWQNGTGDPIASFATTWVVPAAPVTESGQTIFLFNGIQNSGENYGVLQPVLQWGSSNAGGGNFWIVSSWYVTYWGHAFYTPPVAVQEGDTLEGLITLRGSSASGFDYTCEFVGIPETRQEVSGVNELLWCVQAHEAYELRSCSDYPAAQKVTMGNVRLHTVTGPAPLVWLKNSRITDCGQRVEITSDSSEGGSVDIFFRS